MRALRGRRDGDDARGSSTADEPAPPIGRARPKKEATMDHATIEDEHHPDSTPTAVRGGPSSDRRSTTESVPSASVGPRDRPRAGASSGAAVEVDALNVVYGDYHAVKD